MRKIILVIFLLSTITTVYTQEKVLELPESFSISFESSKKSYAFSNPENEDLLLILEENNKLYSHLLDSEYQQKSKIVTQKLSSKYGVILGYSVNNDMYSIFFSNSKKTKFGMKTFDFGTNSSINTILDFKIKGEKYVESVNYKNQFYLITVTKNSSDLNIYIFNKSLQPNKKTISLQQVEYQNPKDQHHTVNAYYLFMFGEGGIANGRIDIKKIESRDPNIMIASSELTKLYQLDNQLIFSFDYSKKDTKLCFIDLDTFTFRYKVFDKPSKTEKGYKKSNSYVYDNKVFQIASSYQKMKFTISDLATKQLIKEYAIQKEDPITFKNSPIIQEVGVTFFGTPNKDGIQKMGKTKKFLKEISSDGLSILAHKIENKYHVILGKTIIINPRGVIGFNTPIGNPSHPSGFTSFYHGKQNNISTYINCLFDQSFEHLQGDIPKNVYDGVNEFEETLEKPKAKNIFLHKDIIHFGFFDKKDRIYKLYRFKE